MTVTLNRRASSMPRSLSTKDGLYWTSEMHGASTGRLPSRKMNSFASMALPTTAGGIWESTTKTRADQGTLRISLWGFQQGPPPACSAESRAGQYQHYDRNGRAPAWYAGRLEGRAGSKRTRAFPENGAGPDTGARTIVVTG